MDLYIFKYLNGFAGKSDFFNLLIIFFAEYLGWVLILCLFTLIIIGFNRKKELKIVLIALNSAIISRFIFTEIIRFLYNRQRPFLVLETSQIINHSATPSFPSGHSAFYFALAFAVYFYHKKIGSLFLTGATLIGISRVIGGIHYPSDILAGAVLGYFTAVLCRFLFQKLCKNSYRIENPQL